MKTKRRGTGLRGAARRQGIGAGVAFGIALTLLGGSLAPALAVGNEPVPVDETSATTDGPVLDAEWQVSEGGSGEAAAPPAAEQTGEPSGEPSDEPSDEAANELPDGASGESSGEPAEAPQVSPLAIPQPTARTAVITVKVGGDRRADGSVAPLAGVRLALHGAGTGTGGGGASGAGVIPPQGSAGARYNAAWSWTTCTSDADGDCSFEVPVRSGSISSTGVPQDTRFWVVQEAAPSGWYMNPNVRIGSFGASPELTWQYRFRTDTRLRAGETYASTTAMPWNTTAADPDRYFMRNRVDANTEDWYAANVGRTTGVWNQSRENPPMIGGCPIDIALIADTSGSLGATGMAGLKETMSAFVAAFQGTNARMAAFSFSNLSPGGGASNHPTLMPVTTSAQAAAFTAQFASWTPGGGTNWDAGFAAAANAQPHYDLAILLTDGNPTVLRDNPGSGSSAYNSIQDVDAGVFSANQLKQEGTRVLSLGVGPALTVASEANLRSVSGPAKNTDYFRAGSFDEATQVLVELAKKRCTGSIGVQKLIIPEGGTVSDAVPAPAGWEFGAGTTTDAARLTPAAQTTVAGGDGKVDFGLSFTPGARSVGVQIHEVQQDGYTHVPVGGQNAVCVNRNSGAQVAVTNSGDAARPAFGVVANENERIECKIYNQPKSPGAIDAVKSSDPASGTAVTPGQEVSYTLTFTNSGGQAAPVEYDDVLTGVLDDADLIGTPTAQSPLAASYDAGTQRIRVTGTLPAGDVKTVTYRVKVKEELPEASDGRLGNFIVTTGEEPPTECEPEDPHCTEHPVVATLSWSKIDGAEPANLLSGSTWVLTPYDAAGQLIPSAAITVEDCVAETEAECTGADTDPRAGKFRLEQLAPGRYSLTETVAPPGYQLLDAPIEVVLNANLALGGIVNTQSEVPVLPLTGGLGASSIFLGAAGLGTLVVLGLLLQRRRSMMERA